MMENFRRQGKSEDWKKEPEYQEALELFGGKFPAGFSYGKLTKKQRKTLPDRIRAGKEGIEEDKIHEDVAVTQTEPKLEQHEETPEKVTAEVNVKPVVETPVTQEQEEETYEEIADTKSDVPENTLDPKYEIFIHRADTNPIVGPEDEIFIHRASGESSVLRPEDEIYKEVQEVPDNESTPFELRKKLRELILGAKEGVGNAAEEAMEHFRLGKAYLTARSSELSAPLRKFGLDVIGDFKVAGKGIAHTVMNPKETLHSIKTGAEKAKAYAGYFVDRNVSLSEKCDKLKTDLTTLTEGYNKLPFRQKAYITAALIGGGSLATVAGLPALHSILAGAMYGQRALGGAGFSLNRRKGMEARITKNKDHWLADKSNTFKNTYAAVLGTAYMGGTAIAGHYAMEKLSDWLGHAFGHTAVGTPAHNVVSPHEYVVPPPEVNTPDMPMVSVEASSGHGYEYMVKRLWEQLQDKHLDASKFGENTDIHKLLTADAHSIDKIVHDIAKDPQHEFFNADGTSVQINTTDYLSLGADGQIHISNEVSSDGFSVHAPAAHPSYIDAEAGSPVAHPLEGSRVTPPYHPEAPVDHSASTAEAPPPAEAPPSNTETPSPKAPQTAPPAETPPPVENAPPAAAETQTPPVDKIVSPVGVVNHYDVMVLNTEPHVYADAGSEHLFVYGGSPEEKAKTILEYLTKNPDKIIYSADANGENRIPWHLVEGKAIPEEPVQVGFWRALFSGDSFMKAPSPEEFEKIIK